MQHFDKEIDSTPKTAAEAKALIGKRVKYLRAADIDRAGILFPQYGTVTGNKGRDIIIRDDVIRPVELVVLPAQALAPGVKFTMTSVDHYLSSFGNVIRNRVGIVISVSVNGRQVRASWAPKTNRGRVATGSVDTEDIQVIPATESGPEPTSVTDKPKKPAAPKLTWRKKKKNRGDWHPAVGSRLIHAGVTVAHTQPQDGAWFWYGGYGTHSRNTSPAPVATEAEAKREAKAFLLSLIAPQAKPPRKLKIKDTEFYVQVTEKSTKTVQDLRGPFNEHKAGKVRDGMSINLNHGRFCLAVVPKSKLKSETLKDCGK